MTTPDLDILLVQLQDGRPHVRLEAVKSLQQNPSRLAVKNLLRSLRDKNAEVRYWAVFALESFIDSRVEQELIQLMDDPSRIVRIAVIKVLGKAKRPSVFEPLLGMLSDRDSDVRTLASEALSSYPEEYFSKMISALDTNVWLRKYHIFKSFVVAGQRAYSAVKQETTKANLSLERRYWLIKVIGELRWKSLEGFLLEQLNENSSEELLCVSLEALGRLGMARTIPSIVKYLYHPKETVRETTVDTLGKLGEYAVTVLLDKLDDDSRLIRFSSSESLAKIGDVSIGPLLDGFYKRDKEGRFWTLSALKKLALPVSHSVFKSLCRDEDLDIQLLSIAALADFPWDGEVLSTLVELLSHTEWKVRNESARTLAALHDVPLEFFRTHLKNGDDNLKYWMIRVMEEKKSPKFVPELLSIFACPQWFLKSAASSALQAIPEKPSQPFLELLESEDENQLYWTVKSLNGEKDKILVNPLVKLLMHHSGGIRKVARETLMSMGDVSIPGMVLVFSESYPRRLYEEISNVLIQMSPLSRDVVLELLRSHDREKNYWGSIIAGGLGDLVLEEIHELLDSGDWKIRTNGLLAVRSIASSDSAERLIPLLEDEYLSIRKMAVECFGRIGDRQVVSHLLPLLQSEDFELRLEVLDALGKIGGESTVEPVSQCLKDDNWLVRKQALKAVSNSASKEYEETLQEMESLVESDLLEDYLDALGKVKCDSFVSIFQKYLISEDTVLLQKAIWGLANLESTRSSQEFLPFLEHPNWEVRKEAVDAIGLSGDKAAVSQLRAMMNKADSVLRVHIRDAMRNLLGEVQWEKLLEDYVSNSKQEQADKFFQVAQRQVREKDWEGAVASLRRAEALHPESRYYFLRARVHAELKDYSTAERLMKQLLSDEPGDLRVLFNLAMLFMVQKKYEQAENVLKNMVQYDLPSDMKEKVQALKAKLSGVASR